MAALIHGRVENVVVFTLPSLPGSINQVYGPGRASVHSAVPRWEIKPQWRRWAGEMGRYVKPLRIEADSLVRCDLWFFYPFYHGNGRLRTCDTHNFVKLTIDVIAKHQGWDDAVVKHGSWGSSNSENGRVAVRLTEVRR